MPEVMVNFTQDQADKLEEILKMNIELIESGMSLHSELKGACEDILGTLQMAEGVYDFA